MLHLDVFLLLCIVCRMACALCIYAHLIVNYCLECGLCQPPMHSCMISNDISALWYRKIDKSTIDIMMLHNREKIWYNLDAATHFPHLHINFVSESLIILEIVLEAHQDKSEVTKLRYWSVDNYRSFKSYYIEYTLAKYFLMNPVVGHNSTCHYNFLAVCDWMCRSCICSAILYGSILHAINFSCQKIWHGCKLYICSYPYIWYTFAQLQFGAVSSY